jgi:hypothetical protein
MLSVGFKFAGLGDDARQGKRNKPNPFWLTEQG